MTGWCTFHLAGHWCGIELDRVREVGLSRPATRVPGAHEAVDGLVNLRGEIVAAISLRRRLHLPAADASGIHLVVSDGDGAASLVVDEMGDVVRSEDARPAPPHAAPAGLPRDALRGVYALPQGLLLALDVDHVLRLA